jgi:N,N'-diacetyllegionaminate synthase
MRTLIIAEVGNNHEGSLDTALWLLKAAHSAGVDIVKFQAGTAEGFARTLEDIPRYRKYELGSEGYWKIHHAAREIGVPVMFSVWGDAPGFNLFRHFHYYKIAARQTSPDFVKAHDRQGVFFSIPPEADLNDYATIRSAMPMHVVPQYPADDPNFKRLADVRDFFAGRFGYSDHCLGIEACVEAVGKYGARWVEKHFTLDHHFGPLRDHVHGATPDEFKTMVEKIRKLEEIKC